MPTIKDSIRRAKVFKQTAKCELLRCLFRDRGKNYTPQKKRKKIRCFFYTSDNCKNIICEDSQLSRSWLSQNTTHQLPILDSTGSRYKNINYYNYCIFTMFAFPRGICVLLVLCLCMFHSLLQMGAITVSRLIYYKIQHLIQNKISKSSCFT